MDDDLHALLAFPRGRKRRKATPPPPDEAGPERVYVNGLKHRELRGLARERFTTPAARLKERVRLSDPDLIVALDRNITKLDTIRATYSGNYHAVSNACPEYRPLVKRTFTLALSIYGTKGRAAIAAGVYLETVAEWIEKDRHFDYAVRAAEDAFASRLEEVLYDRVTSPTAVDDRGSAELLKFALTSLKPHRYRANLPPPDPSVSLTSLDIQMANPYLAAVPQLPPGQSMPGADVLEGEAVEISGDD